MEKFKTLLRFCNRFGWIRGCILYLKITHGYTTNLNVPNIKYPFTLRKGTSDIGVFYQIFLHRHYMALNNNNNNALSLLDKFQHLKDKKIIIDGGANIGLFAIYIKNQYPDAKIICIEPDTENFELLQRNVSPYTDIYCENCGIWDKDTMLRVYDKYDIGKWGIIVEEDFKHGNIPAMSMDSLMKKYAINHIDILKLDIEGSEKEVFSDNIETWLPKVKMIVIELHDRMKEGCSQTFCEAINKSFTKYEFSMTGENVIIKNMNND
jgi:FkbM family methyltransferase